MIKIDEILHSIKDSGFSHVKVELEGQLNRGGNPAFTSERACDRYLMAEMGADARNALVFGYFYRDGSVDSEYTFTMKVEDARYIIDVIEAWNRLALAIGNGCSVEGAGLHISVLTSGTYPSNRVLPEAKITNFERQVTKLLPALFIGATSGNFTRGLRFRYPRISATTKYSAIYTHNDTCLEYRLFETCYQRPEAIFEYLGVIARTLEYYKDPTKKVESLGKSFSFYDDRKVESYLNLSEQVSILKRQFRYIKPEGMTAKEFFSKRGIRLVVKEVKEKEKKEIEKLKLAYYEQKVAHQKIREEPLDEYQKDNLQYWMMVEPNRPADWYWEQVTGRRAKIMSQKRFIENNLGKRNAVCAVSV